MGKVLIPCTSMQRGVQDPEGMAFGEVRLNLLERNNFTHGIPRQLTRLTIQRLGSTGRRLAVLTTEDFEEDARSALQGLNGKVLIGSPAQLDLGLSGEEIKELQKEVDEIHHQMDAFHSKPSRMRETLVGGTRSLLEFALDLPRLLRFVHYSSVFSTGWNRGLVVANARNPAIRRWHNAYERVRWEAEQWVFASMAQIPSIIIRSGLLTGSPGRPWMKRSAPTIS